MQNKCISESMI